MVFKAYHINSYRYPPHSCRSFRSRSLSASQPLWNGLSSIRSCWAVEWWELTLVGLGLSVVHLLILLVDNGVLGCLCAGTEAGVGIFGDVLVGVLGALVGTALDGLRDVVCSVLNQVSKVLRFFRIEMFFTLMVSMVNFEKMTLTDFFELFWLLNSYESWDSPIFRCQWPIFCQAQAWANLFSCNYCHGLRISHHSYRCNDDLYGSSVGRGPNTFARNLVIWRSWSYWPWGHTDSLTFCK